MVDRRDGLRSLRRRARGGADTHPASPAYPAHWEADIALRDGSAAHLRPILPSDADALQEFHQRQSEQSRYLRFFAPMPRLSERDLTRFTHVDHVDRVAFVVLVGEDIVAVGRYDRVDPRSAEVAFNVADSRQGSGLGSVLLEHLAAAARERGIDVFTAEVLPQNTKMIKVFTEAGFDVDRTLDDGVVMVSFRIDPTARSLEVMAEREHRAEARAMERLLHPESVLLVGVSSRADSVGGRFLTALESSGYDGTVHLVAREAFELRGHRAWGRITDVPGTVDLAVIALRPEACLEAIEECARIGVKSVLIPTEGFSESEDGRKLQRELVARVRLHGMRLLGPGSLGFLRTGDDAISLSLAPHMPRPGRVALAGQSTALSAMLLAGTDSRGIGLHEFVGVGNRADVSLNDTLQHWEDDEEVGVIGLALESMGNPRKFTRIARRLTRSTPLIVLRPPGIESNLPPGHDVRTSSLPRRALDQVLASAGVVQTRGVDHLLDVVDAIGRQGLPLGPRVGLLSNTAALGASLRGAADAAGLQVVADNRSVPLSPDPRLVQRAFTSMAALGEVDMVIAGIVDPQTAEATDTLRQMAVVARHSEVVLLVCVVTTAERFAEVQQQVRVDDALPPVHATPYAVVRVGAGMLAAATRPSAEDEEPARRDDLDRAAARELVDRLVPEDLGSELVLGPEDTAALLAAYGIATLPSRTVTDEDDTLATAAEIGYPVALKSTDPVLRHRADLGGVRLDIPDEVQLRHALQSMRRDLAFSSAPLEVQAMAPAGVPMVVRSVEDPSLGPVVSLSVAGDATDLLDDIAYAIPPFSEQGAHRLVDAPATAVKLRGTRGLPPADRDALADLVVRVGLLAEDLPELASLELYPVLVAQDGVSVVGASARLAAAPNRTDGARRTLSEPPGA
ncbi:bifunctional acetate--CoA ligase family protein/GNAT family N-acetyltransferase [Brachybacterium aquaticum]|uniref:Acyl-CoA synthetase (NDP forming)/GNAT superfamily N-acetyltransferase n=1 Tax=Brachybacterium aquaticum TaxID=1432564 RepID=A0A841AE89_9MICO|nr:GNAT family N-acetyltransferase [Brachybacterium aquaticum]MBB5831602.1 acyl-CoA synthetase (NDP forming)/GNAT superfamily N-acetyltransferase [Brachybacterium aquaticum]